MNRLTVLLLASLFAAGCSKKREPTPQGTGTGSAGSAAAPADAATATAPADAETVKAHMRKHFDAVSDLQRAIAHGQLAQAKADAQWLIDHEEVPVPEWRPFLDEVRAAATEVIAAADVPTAAVLAARLGHACSQCHQDRAATLAFEWSEPPLEAADLKAQMKRHQWAAARLWEGLVGPSDEMWKQGASVLSKTQLDIAGATGGTPRGDVPALAARVRELAKRAATEDDHAARATLYGELLSTCAGCHALVRPAPVPTPATP